MSKKKKKIKEGKKFEEDIKSSFEKENIILIRLKDSPSSFAHGRKTRFTNNNPCDFITYNSNNNHMILLELKSTNAVSLPFINLKESQLKQMKQLSKQEGIDAYLLINFRKSERTYIINNDYIYDFYYGLNKKNKERRKSIPEDFIKEFGIKVEGFKKITRFKYNIGKMMKEI